VATILQSWRACDGWNVEAVIEGRRMVVHFTAEPTEQQQADTIAGIEARLQEEATQEEEVLEIVE
jgi:hypothetical protein